MDCPFYHLQCISCGHRFQEKHTTTHCLKCLSPLEVCIDYDWLRQRINHYSLKHAPLSALKYLSFYPIKNWENIISMNEGGTPLHLCKNLGDELGHKYLYIKNEGMNPTGVFKDRGTLVEISKVRELGAKAVCLASTGNMAASVAAYCTLAKLPCYVLVPEGTPIGKLAQTLSFGARIIQVRGTYTDCSKLSEKMAKQFGFYLAGDYAFRLEGQKSISFEIVEQLSWNVPDMIICPVGCGTNLSAIWKGFTDLHTLGLIHKLPKLIGVQANGCNPLVKAYQKKQSIFEVFDRPSTICSAVQVGDPLDGLKVLKAIYDSKGMMISVHDEEVLETEQLLAKKEAIFGEPSGVMPLTAFTHLHKRKLIKEEDKVVLIMTGNGLKDPKSAVKILPDPPTIDPDIREVEKYIKSKLYDIQPVSIKTKEEILYKTTSPKLSDLRTFIANSFGVKLSSKLIQEIQATIESFILKGKAVTRQDLQNIVEEHLDEYVGLEKILEILDFETTTSQKKPAEGTIWIRLANTTLSASAKGTGTVDALITALKTCLKKRDTIHMELTDYQVEIFSPGVKANVKVIIKAKDREGNAVIGQAVSPDVIVASLFAYEKCYNFLHHKRKYK